MGKIIIITGASRGIGAATALLAAERGYAVCVNYIRNREAADAVVRSIERTGGRAIAVAADVSVEADVIRLFQTVDEKLGPLTALVNNAGILDRQMKLEQMTAARLNRIFATNVTGSFLCAREAVRRIVILTILIKLAFFHLSATSYRSMARMRNLQPRLLALKERYGDDKAKLNQAMMELYRTEKVNPLGGCLPIVVQIPVFIALYWVLLESVELRQAPFLLWIRDLSTNDPYFVLPILMGITMVIQQRLNPAPLDPIQQKVMMILPVVFTVFFLFFPAGLVLYWLVNNTLSILQQWVITRQLVKEPAA